MCKEKCDEKINSIVTGVLFDFMGWLTTRKEKLVLSSSDDLSPAVSAIQEFLVLREIEDYKPNFEWVDGCVRKVTDIATLEKNILSILADDIKKGARLFPLMIIDGQRVNIDTQREFIDALSYNIGETPQDDVRVMMLGDIRVFKGNQRYELVCAYKNLIENLFILDGLVTVRNEIYNEM